MLVQERAGGGFLPLSQARRALAVALLVSLEYTSEVPCLFSKPCGCAEYPELDDVVSSIASAFCIVGAGGRTTRS